MKVSVNRKGRIIDHATLCHSLWSQARGLIFRRPQSLIFVFSKDKKVRLHMMGVFFQIDILTLSKEKVVLEKACIAPLQFFRSMSDARYVIEMPKGTAEHISVGDRLQWINKA